MFSMTLRFNKSNLELKLTKQMNIHKIPNQYISILILMEVTSEPANQINFHKKYYIKIAINTKFQLMKNM